MEIKAGECYVDRFANIVMIKSVSFLFVTFQNGNSVETILKSVFKERYPTYSHYVPTHQEIG